MCIIMQPLDAKLIENERINEDLAIWCDIRPQGKYEVNEDPDGASSAYQATPVPAAERGFYAFVEKQFSARDALARGGRRSAGRRR